MAVLARSGGPIPSAKGAAWCVNIILYSDGSLLTVDCQRKVGASYVAHYPNKTIYRRRIAMSRRSEVYDAEMASLYWEAIDTRAFIAQNQ